MLNQKICFLVDNDPDDQEIFQMALAEANPAYEFVSVSNGVDALQYIQNDASFVPDVIFIDMNMPMMNGQQCLKEIKAIERLNHVPVYIYSTTSDMMLEEAVKADGAKDYIIKPPSFKKLSEILATVLNH